MTEEEEKGNFICKLDCFLNSCILRGWKDSMLTLQSTRSLPLWSEELGITSRCIDAIALKTQAHPSRLNWLHSTSRGRADASLCNGIESQQHRTASKGWWAEDIAELGIDLYWRTVVAIKAGGRIPAYLIGEALKIYASRWLPNICKDVNGNKHSGNDQGSEATSDITSKHRLILESIVSLLPMEKGSVSCGFLLKLLKAGNILGASYSSKIELARRVGLQLEESNVSDLLIPSLSYTNETAYDVDIVLSILEQFMQGQSPPTSPPRAKTSFEKMRRSRYAEHIDYEFQDSRRSSSASHSSKLKVAKLVDEYLQEIARDANLALSKVIALAEAIPDFARIDHDDLYRAIDIYLKSHRELSKSERKKLCRVLDCKKLSMEACMHAAQNELLPLRVVVQVLFFECARAAVAGGQLTDLPNNIKALFVNHGDDTSRIQQKLGSKGTGPADDKWNTASGLKSSKLKLSTLRMKLAEEDNDIDDNGHVRTSKLKGVFSIPSRPKRMLSKLWPSNRSVSERH